uniref:Uncharacterized protein n=1 Tax=Ursus maritimus TaxID=29073 RepID=A0A452VG51_URSMA
LNFDPASTSIATTRKGAKASQSTAHSMGKRLQQERMMPGPTLVFCH